MRDVENIDPSRIVIANSGDVSPDIIAYAKEVIKSKNVFEEVIEAKAGCTISAHCGPKTFAIFYINK